VKVLITAGGTRERIDGVRFISNDSTGSTGLAIAEACLRAGLKVHYLHAAGSNTPAGHATTGTFTDFESLDLALRRALAADEFAALIHLAAVSDFSVDQVIVGDRSFSPSELARVGKLSSSGADRMRIELKRNPKIVDRIREYAHGRLGLLIAFKLTNTESPAEHEQAVLRLYESSLADVIVHNDQSEKSEGGARPFGIYTDGRIAERLHGVDELSASLIHRIQRRRAP
jgi:phosphopantothenoylcysteine synthetase/decarboxylase